MLPRVGTTETTSRDPDRLVLFTDAVIAIAITLLVLPLVEVVAEPHEHASEVVTENLPKFWSFVLSFAVIARLWLTHHRTFEHVKAYNRVLIWLNMAWLFTMVVLPFPTGMIGTYGTEHFTVILYISTILVSSALQSALILYISRKPEIQDDENPLRPPNVANAVSATGLMALALLLSALVPALNYFTLFALMLSPVVIRIWGRFQPSVREQR
jgi:TMEM175 potassium channel family protein